MDKQKNWFQVVLLWIFAAHGSNVLGGENAQVAPSNLGGEVYQKRCVLCHGITGEGDGKLARVIIDPPPFDLTRSQVPQAYRELIIREGGGLIGRSDQMPAWKQELSESEIKAVARYIGTFQQELN